MITPTEAVLAEMARQGITITSEFVPWSKSRSFEEGRPVWTRTLQWKVRLLKHGREVLATEYMAGIAHCPAYKAPKNVLGHSRSLVRHAAVEFETEHGLEYRETGKGRSLEPNPVDVIHSLCLDGEAIYHATFDDWACSFGYDSDSCKAEKIYRACLEIGLKMRAALGDAGFGALRAACQDY